MLNLNNEHSFITGAISDDNCGQSEHSKQTIDSKAGIKRTSSLSLPCFFLLPSLPMGDGLYMLWQNGLPAGKNSRLAAVFFGLDDKDRRLREDGSLMWALMLPECKRLIVLSFFTKTLVFPNFRIHSFCMKEVTCIIF